MLYKQTPAAASTFSNECHCELVRTSFEGKVWYLLWHRRKNDELRGRFYSGEQKDSTSFSYRLSVFSSFRSKFQSDVSQEYPQDIIPLSTEAVTIKTPIFQLLQKANSLLSAKWNLRIEIKNLNLNDAPLPCFPNHSTESPVAVRALRTWCELKHPSCEEVSLTEADISTQIRRPARENPADQRVARRANNNIDAGGRWKNKASQLLVDCWTYGATFSSVFALKIRALLSGNLEREREGESYDFYPSNFRWSALGERFQGFRLFYLGGDSSSSLNSSIFFPDENRPRRLKAYAGREQTSRFRNAIPWL